MKELVEVREDRHNNLCEIYKFEKDHYVVKYVVKYQGSGRYWLNRKTGSPYFSTLTTARRKIANN